MSDIATGSDADFAEERLVSRYNADLANWKEVMATLCTFADEKEFPDLCDALGDRLEEQVQQQPEARKDASFCYLAGSKLDFMRALGIVAAIHRRMSPFSRPNCLCANALPEKLRASGAATRARVPGRPPH